VSRHQFVWCVRMFVFSFSYFSVCVCMRVRLCVGWCAFCCSIIVFADLCLLLHLFDLFCVFVGLCVCTVYSQRFSLDRVSRCLVKTCCLVQLGLRSLY